MIGEYEELRALVLPILAAAHHAYCHDTGCFDGDDISNPEIERAAILVVAQVRERETRNRPCDWRNQGVLTCRERDDWPECVNCEPCRRVAAAEALVARVKEE